MPQYLGSYSTRNLTTAETTLISQVTGAVKLAGMLCNSTGTCVVTFYAGTTATSSTLLTGPVRVNTTVPSAYVNQSQWIPIPAIAVNGLIVTLGATNDPNVTIFYDPS